MDTVECCIFKVTLHSPQSIDIVSVYSAPSTKVQYLTKCISSILMKHKLHPSTTVVPGDFNVNIDMNTHSTDKDNLLSFFLKRNYQQLVHNWTTDGQTCIDHVYTGITDNISVGVWGTYYSYQ